LAAATVGTALLQQVLRDAPTLLSPSGELLIISSTLAEPEIRSALPSDMDVEEAARRLVPFDIEAIRGEGEDEHISWLRTERGLEMRGKTLFHNIAIFRVRHSSDAPANLTAGGSLG
jgi:hypothetical protein